MLQDGSSNIVRLADTENLDQWCRRRLTFSPPSEVPERLYVLWSRSEKDSELKELSRKRLVCICRRYGLSTTLLKRDLVLRIVRHEKKRTEQSCWRIGVLLVGELLPA